MASKSEGWGFIGEMESFIGGAEKLLEESSQIMDTPGNMKTVLLVEDDSNDQLLMKLACQRTGIPHTLLILSDGEAAINYFTGKAPYSDRVGYPLPDLLFLDIKIPKRNGHEVLQWLREQPQFKYLPVVMMTHSTQMEDMDRAYKLGVTSYLRKVASQAEFGQAVRVILKYWLEINLSPGEHTTEVPADAIKSDGQA